MRNRGTERRRLLVSVTAAAAALLLGCGDDGALSDTGPPVSDTGIGDGATDTGDSGVLDSSGGDALVDSGIPPSCTAADLGHLLVVTTAADFSRAGVGTVDLTDTSSRTATDDLPDSDSVAAQAACVGFILSRGQGIASVVSDADPLVVSHTIPLDPGGAIGPYASNPQTVVAGTPDKAFVVQQARNAVTIIDPTMMGEDAVLGEIDLSPYLKPGDTDGLVDAVDAITIADRLFVALGHYWFEPTTFAIQFEGSELAVIDASSHNLIDIDPATDGIQGIDLAGENPWRGLHHDETANALWVASSGDSFLTDGQLEVVDLTRMMSSGLVVSEAELAGEINGFAVVSPTRVAILRGTDLVMIDPTLDLIAVEVIASEMDGLLLHRDTIWAWARTGEEPGLAAFDALTGAETTPASGRINFADLPVFDVVPVR